MCGGQVLWNPVLVRDSRDSVLLLLGPSEFWSRRLLSWTETKSAKTLLLYLAHVRYFNLKERWAYRRTCVKKCLSIIYSIIYHWGKKTACITDQRVLFCTLAFALMMSIVKIDNFLFDSNKVSGSFWRFLIWLYYFIMINYKNSVLQIIMEIYYTLQQQQIICIIFKANLGTPFSQ